MKQKLSDRIRPNSEAARWVVDEVKQMEARIRQLESALKPLVAMHHEYKEADDGGDGGYVTSYWVFVKGRQPEWEAAVNALKEAKS